MYLAPQQYRGNEHFLSETSTSRHEVMVGGALERDSAVCVGLGVGISSLFCRSTQCM